MRNLDAWDKSLSGPLFLWAEIDLVVSESPERTPERPGLARRTGLLQAATGAWKRRGICVGRALERRRPSSPAEAAVEVEEAAEAPSDEPYIETPRCTTCNECTELNNKMFAYNENMQAYIADLDAGPYRQLVEAAESCQVSIIHPGKPKNRNEPNLDELLERAAPFN